MSVCFFVPADQAGTSAASEDTIEAEGVTDENVGTDSSQALQEFWVKVNEDIEKITAEDFKSQVLPLARIKKIMKLDEEVKMISSEAPVLFAKAAEIFIHELTLRAWAHTENNKRRTLQRNDIAMAISKSDQFDFLIDIVPRHDVKPYKPRDDTLNNAHTNEQVSQPQVSLQTQQPQFVLPTAGVQVVQSATPTPAPSTSSNVVSPHPVTLIQQLVTSSGEVQQVPLQLSQAQLNMIRLQMQNNPNQPIIIQAPTQQSPQLIQVTSQGQSQPLQQVYIAHVTSAQEDS